MDDAPQEYRDAGGDEPPVRASFREKLAGIAHSEPMQVLGAMMLGFLQLLVLGAAGSPRQHLQTVRVMRWGSLLLLLVLLIVLAARLPLPKL